MNEMSNGTSFQPISRLEIIGQLRAHLTDVMPEAETLWATQRPTEQNADDRRRPLARALRLPGRQTIENPIAFRGHLAIDSAQAYGLLRERFASLGYTPLLRNQEGFDFVIAIPYLFESKEGSKSTPRKWVPNLVLLLITLLTTTLMGAVMEQAEQLMANPRLLFQQPSLILTGIPAALTIMSILGIHELSHYVVARKHGLETTLPFFIPVPFGFGTFGAIIRIRTPWENRNALFDVGVAGPLAGLLVAFPLFFLGLMLSPARPPIPEGTPLGSPLLLRGIEELVYAIRGIPPEHEIYVNAMTFAAWFGLVVTGFNLLPVGQLDGGHVAYAVLGRWGKAVGIATLVGLVVLGTFVWSGWYVWAAFIFLSGWQHPAPLNALQPLGRKRLILGILVFILTALLFTPAPFPI
jgi:membrane-associated protease RseP (regulator of RpoE activity)